MRGFALFVACFALFNAEAKAAPKCDSVDAMIGYERVVKSGETSTYFSPHMNIGGSQDAGFAISTSADAVAVCKALGHTNGNLGSYNPARMGEHVVILNASGVVAKIVNACEGANCNLTATTVTCW